MARDCYCNCNTWYSNRTGQCQCGSNLNGRLICHANQTVDISAGFCITYDARRKYTGVNTSGLVVGDCAYGYLSKIVDRKYSHVPIKPVHVNHSQCDPYKRKGLFCGECKKGYGPSVYSFSLHCANCSYLSTATATCLYILIKFLPITFFFFFLLIFRFNLMTGPKLGYVMFCQSIINTLQYSRYLYFSLFDHLPQPFFILGHISLALAGILNLEFFRFVIPPFCISEEVTALHLQMLGFVSTFYPLFLVLFAYITIELSARCNSMNRCIAINRFITTYNMEHSIIRAFATFTMLSIFSTLCQGYAILQTTRMLDMDGSALRSVWYSDPELTMFSSHHLPYVITSLLFVFILVASPGLLLSIYPTRLYIYLSQFLSTRNQLKIKIFAETVNGEFKNGLDNTYDYRALPGVFIILALVFSLLMSTLPHYGFDGYPPLSIGLIFASASLLTSYLQPCKSRITNISLSFHLLLIGVLSFGCALWWQDLTLDSEVLASAIVVICVIPHALMLMWVVHSILHRYNYYQSHSIQTAVKLFRNICGICGCNSTQYSQLSQVTLDTDEERVN